MAGFYPVSMKIAATRTKVDLGLLIGIMVGALTLGTAAPRLFNAFGGINWRFAIGVGSCAGAGADTISTSANWRYRRQREYQLVGNVPDGQR